MSLIALCLHPNNCEKHDDTFHSNFAFSALVVDDRDDFNDNDENTIDLLFSDDDDVCMSFGCVDDDEMGNIQRPLTTNKGSDDMLS